MQLQLHASAAMQHVQWPSLHWPAQGSTVTARWCGSQTLQATLWNNNNSSSSGSCGAETQHFCGMHSAAAADSQCHQPPAEPSSSGSSSSSSSNTNSNDSSISNQHQQQQQQQQPTTFADMGLPDILLQALQAQGFAAPTPVQVAAQQAVLSGRNVALQSATGTGKVSSSCAGAAAAAAAVCDDCECAKNVALQSAIKAGKVATYGARREHKQTTASRM
jgi:hypothetical protein